MVVRQIAVYFVSSSPLPSSLVNHFVDYASFKQIILVHWAHKEDLGTKPVDSCPPDRMVIWKFCLVVDTSEAVAFLLSSTVVILVHWVHKEDLATRNSPTI